MRKYGVKEHLQSPHTSTRTSAAREDARSGNPRGGHCSGLSEWERSPGSTPGHGSGETGEGQGVCFEAGSWARKWRRAGGEESQGLEGRSARTTTLPRVGERSAAHRPPPTRISGLNKGAHTRQVLRSHRPDAESRRRDPRPLTHGSRPGARFPGQQARGLNPSAGALRHFRPLLGLRGRPGPSPFV